MLRLSKSPHPLFVINFNTCSLREEVKLPIYRPCDVHFEEFITVSLVLTHIRVIYSTI